MRRSSRSVAVLAGAVLAGAVLLGTTACGPAGSLTPVPPTDSEPAPTPSTSESAAPAQTPIATPTQEPSATASPPAVARTPPPAPELPMPRIDPTEVVTLGPDLEPGARYDYVVTCDPRIPMWFDDGDGAYSWESADRWIECEEGMIALLALGVGADASRLQTLFEEDLGVPLVIRTPSGQGFDEATVAAVVERVGTDSVELEAGCSDAWAGSVQVGDLRADCGGALSLRLPGLRLSEVLAALEVSPGFERQIWLYPAS